MLNNPDSGNHNKISFLITILPLKPSEMWYQIRDRLLWRYNDDAGSSSDNRNAPRNNVNGTKTPTPNNQNIDIHKSNRPDILQTTPEVNNMTSRNPFPEDPIQDQASSEATNPSKPSRRLENSSDHNSDFWESIDSLDTAFMPSAVDVPLSQEVTKIILINTFKVRLLSLLVCS